MNPTHLADQTAAAVAHARSAVRTVGQCHGGRVADTAAAPWVRGQAAELLAAIAEDRADICPHIGANPTVVFAAAWKPLAVYCGACAPDLLAIGAAEDYTCDRCRRRVKQIRPGLVAIGAIVYNFGLCSQCAEDQNTNKGAA